MDTLALGGAGMRVFSYIVLNNNIKGREGSAKITCLCKKPGFLEGTSKVKRAGDGGEAKLR